MLLHVAIDRHRSGRSAEAATFCRHVLARLPDLPQALLLLGVILADGLDPEAGIGLMTRYLELVPDDAIATYDLAMRCQQRGNDAAALALIERATMLAPDFAPAFHQLGMLRQQFGHPDAAAALERAVRLAPEDALVHNNLGHLYYMQGRTGDALAAFDRALEIDPELASAHCNRGLVLTMLELTSDALAAFRAALAIQPDDITAQLGLAEALEWAYQPEEAQRHRAKATRRQGLLIERSLGGPAEARILLICSSGRCDVPLPFVIDRRRFDRISLFLQGDPESDRRGAALIAELPPFDVVFNAIADPDRGEPFLTEAAELCTGLGRATLNPPEALARTRRDRIPALLAGIPGLAVPVTRRLTRAELAAAVGYTPDRPLLVRPIGSHGGFDLERLEGAADLAPYLDRQPAEAYFLTDYWEHCGADGYYRKYRFIFVDRQVYPYHLALMRHWKVHYWRAEMASISWMRDEEAAFLEAWESVFPGILADAVRRVAQTLDLDFAGMDCGITSDGRVLLFEANANMLVHLNDSPERFAYKHRHVPRIQGAMSDLIRQRAAAARD